MKKSLIILVVLFLFCLQGCGNSGTDTVRQEQKKDATEENVMEESAAVKSKETEADEEEKKTDMGAYEEEKKIDMGEDKMKDNIMNIQIGNTVLKAGLSDNPSVDAFKELLKKGPLAIDMSDYGSFEKVGSIGTTLPSDDKRITTSPGDIMLYSSNQIVMFYGSNSWSYTRIGRIEGMTESELKEAFGAGNVEVIFSLP